MMIAILHLLLCISFEFLLVCGLFQPHSSNISNESTIFGPTALTKTPISKQTSSSIAKVTKTVSPTASTALSKVLISSTINAPITTITTTTVSTTASIRNCAVGWLEYEDHCYLFNKRANGKTWIDAQLSCQSYGGNLLSLADQAENSFIRRYTGPASRLYEDYWIGVVL
ncbi:perlucin-like protein isoform X2 [Hydra vulgaris]|uniref:perlucin-like protein isoform X2 n=1 Tax=Hydra vulgaris TaxID=6087 RepID=UPI0032EA1D83